MPFLWPAGLTKARCQTCRKSAEENCGHSDGFAALLPLEISSFGDSDTQHTEKQILSRGKFHTMRRKLLRDWQAVVTAKIAKSRNNEAPVHDSTNYIDNIDQEFIYNWCIVNTRSFYFLHENETPPTDPDDAMVLCPFIDLFNHTDESVTNHCTVSFDDTGFTVTANRAYRAGEELLVSYGAHSNDFLMGEYGFLLPSNGRDTVPLDRVILPDLTQAQKQTLQHRGYLGGYALQHPSQDARAKPEVCFRTQVAAHLLVLPYSEWMEFVNGTYKDPVFSGEDRYSERGRGKISNVAQSGPSAAERANEKICAWLERCRDAAQDSLSVLKEMWKAGEAVRVFGGEEEAQQGEDKERRRKAAEKMAKSRYDMVVLRWVEIVSLCRIGLGEIVKEKERSEEGRSAVLNGGP